MIASKSPLEWKKFGILNWEQNFIEPDQGASEVSLPELFDDYKIDIDFVHKDTDNYLIQVFVKIGINDIDEPKAGYRIFIEAVGIFDTTMLSELEESHQQNLKLFATLNLMIGRIRGIIPMLTGQSLFGAYNLPPLDLSDLLSKKAKSVNQEDSKK